MVKMSKSKNRKNRKGKGFGGNSGRARKINASTPYETCGEQLSPFGGLLAMIKFLDLIGFKQIFDAVYCAPAREPKLGHYPMVTGLLMLLFIGFNRIWHFTYVRLDAILCGFFRLPVLPVASTFWRYLDSMGLNQAQSLLKIMDVLRERVWRQLGLGYYRICIDIDTTVETLYGEQQGGRKGHNTQHRGKKGYRPVLCFIEQTREYLLGKLRKGETISGKQTADFITQIKFHIPGCVKQVLVRADGEFLSWESVKAAKDSGFDFIIANKKCTPPFNPSAWYRPRQRKDIEYNSCIYQPIGWEERCRFVAMRIPKEQKPLSSSQPVQYPLFEDDRYKYRIFCTTLAGPAHEVVDRYDKRAGVENLVGEAKREGLSAIPSGKFKNNYAFFQMVMLAYNIWRYMKLLADESLGCTDTEKVSTMKTVAANTLRIARLKLLYIAAKVVKDQNRDKVKYSIHDARTPAMIRFLKFLDKARIGPKPWADIGTWPQGFAAAT
jgi:hypothetical protein